MYVEDEFRDSGFWNLPKYDAVKQDKINMSGMKQSKASTMRILMAIIKIINEFSIKSTAEKNILLKVFFSSEISLKAFCTTKDPGNFAIFQWSLSTKDDDAEKLCLDINLLKCCVFSFFIFRDNIHCYRNRDNDFQDGRWRRLL